MRAALLITCLLLPAAAHALAPDFPRAGAALAAHRAIYTLHLKNSPKDAVTAATGTMRYEVIDACDAWTTNQTLIMDVTNADGQTVHMTSDYATWEAKNGTRLRFRVRQTTDTAVTLQLAGEAQSGPGGGTIHYSQPKPSTLTLSPGTLFPMVHTAHILALADTGQKFITLPLFDGSSDSGAEDTFIVVTGTSPPQPNRFAGLSALPSTIVNVAFFDRDSKTAEPDYQAAMRYWRNGVGDELSMNFGDFTMSGALQKLTLTPHAC